MVISIVKYSPEVVCAGKVVGRSLSNQHLLFTSQSDSDSKYAQEAHMVL